MADCQFGDDTKWKISRSGIKKTVLEMGAITGNGNAISSIGKLRSWVITYLQQYPPWSSLPLTCGK
jgi:hypothetical protein